MWRPSGFKTSEIQGAPDLKLNKKVCYQSIWSWRGAEGEHQPTKQSLQHGIGYGMVSGWGEVQSSLHLIIVAFQDPPSTFPSQALLQTTLRWTGADVALRSALNTDEESQLYREGVKKKKFF